MAAGWLTSAILIAVLTTGFGHFETVRPWWRRIIRWLPYLAITGLIGATARRPWTFLWIIGLPVLGAAFHVAWCRRNGIHPLTAEPRDCYETTPPPLTAPNRRGGPRAHAHKNRPSGGGTRDHHRQTGP
jgi:hypothetical protein